MATIQTRLQASTHDDVHAQVEQLACGLDPHEYLTGTWLRELAIILALHDDLVVSVVTYAGSGRELEVRLAIAPSSNGLVIGRGATGDQAQISLDLWVGIKDGPGVEHAVGMVRAPLRATGSVTQS
jgi:hypothetical protein